MYKHRNCLVGERVCVYFVCLCVGAGNLDSDSRREIFS